MDAEVDAVPFLVGIPIVADGHALEQIHEELGGVVGQNENTHGNQDDAKPALGEYSAVKEQNGEFDTENDSFVATLGCDCRL